MPFYVPLGPRGLLIRLGAWIISVSGSWVYWRASRRRAVMTIPAHCPEV